MTVLFFLCNLNGKQTSQVHKMTKDMKVDYKLQRIYVFNADEAENIANLGPQTKVCCVALFYPVPPYALIAM